MRLQLRDLNIIGGNRTIRLTPGLNLITGPITTGKTALLQLARLLLTSRIHMEDFPPEIKDNVSGLSGVFEIGERAYSIYRPFVSTLTASVEISSSGEAWMLPAAAPSELSDLTFDKWLLQRLELPDIRVPRAPTQPESESSPVTINDYHLYCRLPQDEIDDHVFGTRNNFTDIKRRYVFEIIYGVYDVQIAQLQERLRQVLTELRQLSGQTAVFARFLAGTQLANRAALLEQLEAARRAKEELNQLQLHTATPSQFTPRANALRSEIQSLDLIISDNRTHVRNEQRAIEGLVRLNHQLQAQMDKLTRAIVSEEVLIDFEFIVCPRCGTGLNREGLATGICTLCLQEPTPEVPNREDLLVEQDRISNQLRETRELIQLRRSAVEQIQQDTTEQSARRSELSSELDFEIRTYISDSASRLQEGATLRSSLDSDISRISEYLKIHESLDQTSVEIQRLASEREQLEAQIESAMSSTTETEARIEVLERNFQSVLDRFKAPQFDEPIVAEIDRRNYLPILSGRSFRELSSQGLKVIVNVALAVAHQLTSIELGLGLPQVLFIDGLTSNMGHEGADLERVNAMYDYLIELSVTLGNDLQLIIADNDVPQQAQEYIRLRLDEDNRLISY